MQKNHQENFRKRKTREDLPYNMPKLYCQAAVLTVMWWQHKNKQIMLRNRSIHTDEGDRLVGKGWAESQGNSTDTTKLFKKINNFYQRRQWHPTPVLFLAWKIPWTEEPDGLQSMGSRRVRHDWATSLSLFTFMHWRRKWQPTPVFLPGESPGWRSLVGCRLWGHAESDTTEAT